MDRAELSKQFKYLVDQQGWTNKELVPVLLDFINKNGLAQELIDQLEEQAGEEDACTAGC